MGERLVVRFDIDDALQGEPFPPLTIATLVENAIKHGIAPSPEGGGIAITVRHDGTMIEASVTDSGVGFTGQASGHGIGLANIRSRLATLYGGAAHLSLQANHPSGVRACICLPRQSGAVAPRPAC
jgi:LytS/YehU family sensor histidine kinase